MYLPLPPKVKSYKKPARAEAGFTLMEVMVSVSIFAIIITIGIGSLLTIYSTLKKTRADQQTIDSLSYVLDTMTRRLRTGTQYVSNDPSSITFVDQVDNGEGGYTITYEAGPDPSTGDYRIYSTSSVDDIQYDITPQDLVIEAFDIDLYDTGQPMVTIHLSGRIKNGRDETPLSIQATVSQRAFESAPTPLVNSDLNSINN